MEYPFGESSKKCCILLLTSQSTSGHLKFANHIVSIFQTHIKLYFNAKFRNLKSKFNLHNLILFSYLKVPFWSECLIHCSHHDKITLTLAWHILDQLLKNVMVRYISEIRWDHKNTLKWMKMKVIKQKNPKFLEAGKLNGNVKTSMHSEYADNVPFPRMYLSF